MDNKIHIKFKGELAKENKKILAKEIFKVTIFATLLPTIIIISVIIMLSVKYSLLYLIFLFIPISLFLGSLLTPFLTLESTKEVLIQDGTVYITYGKFKTSRDISYLKKIIVFSDGYYLKFYFPHKCIYCFCQKNLIVDGSIKDFEEYFKDKLVKKA